MKFNATKYRARNLLATCNNLLGKTLKKRVSFLLRIQYSLCMRMCMFTPFDITKLHLNDWGFFGYAIDQELHSEQIRKETLYGITRLRTMLLQWINGMYEFVITIHTESIWLHSHCNLEATYFVKFISCCVFAHTFHANHLLLLLLLLLLNCWWWWCYCYCGWAELALWNRSKNTSSQWKLIFQEWIHSSDLTEVYILLETLH